MSNNIPTHQRMFHGSIRAVVLGDQLAARFNDRQHRVTLRTQGSTTLIQIGSKHGTPLTLHLADTAGGVLVTMSRGRDWLDRAADASELLERAARNPLSLLAAVPDIIGEMRAGSLVNNVWDAINDLCSLSRSLSGEVNAPRNPIVCPFCQTSNPPGMDQCQACGGPLPVDLPRICPKCSRAHTSEALFCQACGTRLITG